MRGGVLLGSGRKGVGKGVGKGRRCKAGQQPKRDFPIIILQFKPISYFAIDSLSFFTSSLV